MEGSGVATSGPAGHMPYQSQIEGVFMGGISQRSEGVKVIHVSKEEGFSCEVYLSESVFLGRGLLKRGVHLMEGSGVATSGPAGHMPYQFPLVPPPPPSLHRWWG